MESWKQHLLRAVAHCGSQEKLAKAMGTNQSRISWLLKTAEQISAEDSLAADRATDGVVSASQLRPDLWPTPQHVPDKPSTEPERVGT